MGKQQWGDFRLRLVVWYTLLSGLTLLVFDTFLYFQFREGLQRQVDQSLEVAALQAINNIDDGYQDGNRDDSSTENLTLNYPGTVPNDYADPRERLGATENDIVYVNGALNFDPRRDAPALAEKLNRAGVSVYLLDLEGKVRGHFGRQLTVLGEDQLRAGFTTRREAGERWRIYTRNFPLQGDSPKGWIKVAQSLSPVEETAANLRRQMVLGVPIVLALLGIGGFVLGDRALKPLEKITRTAQRVRLSGDLSQRINYQGAEDELGRLAIMFDEMMESLQTTFEREQRFNADVSHELRTPLTAMKGRLSVALSQSRTIDEYEGILHAFTQEVDRLIRLSSDLLLLSRLEQGCLKGQTESLDLGELLDAIADQVRPLADLKCINFSIHMPSGLTVEAQPDHLIRLFLNLLDNAIKHTPRGGKISFQAQPVGPHAHISIADTGPGIAPVHLPHLFERFYRVEADRSRRTGGSGLGLAIAYEITQLYDGSITVESHQNRGTTFTVTLPIS